MPKAFFRGIQFPFAKGVSTTPAAASDADLLKQSIYQILMTGRGERVQRPDFGSNVLRYVFESNNELLGELLRAEVQAALGRFEPRVSIVDIRVVRNDNDIRLDIDYIINATRQQDTLAVPLQVGSRA